MSQKQLSVYLLFFFFILITSCHGQDEKSLSENARKELKTNSTETSAQKNMKASSAFKLPFDRIDKRNVAAQVGEYIREIFQDKNGTLWFGTLAYGLGRFDGEALIYLSKKDGLIGNQINDITEDKAGNLWFATTDGVSKYDGTSFTNFTKEEGLKDNSTWSILADRKGNIWVGTMKGISRYDGSSFSDFKLPEIEVENLSFRFDPRLAWTIIEDRKGNIWFGRDGLGACKYDGKTFSHFTRADGLCNNNIRDILEDQQGGFWFGSWETRVPESENSFKYVDSNDGGLTRFDGKSFTQFSEVRGIAGENVGPIYEDSFGDIWIASMHHGVFKYDGEKFTSFKENQKITNNCIQSILADKDGKYWFGFSGGLFRFDGSRFVNVTKDHPWLN